MMKMKKSRLALIIIGVVLSVLLLLGISLYFFFEYSDLALISKSDYEKAAELVEKYEKLYNIQETIDDRSLWDVDTDDHMEDLYKAAVEAVDDKYSYYMTAEEYEEWENLVTGTFTGVGIAFSQNTDGSFVVNRVMEGGPAELGGMKAGDVILKVDGKVYDDSNEMAGAIRGEEGTSVEITYERKNREKTVSLVRAEVKELSVYADMLEDDYGYMQITSFEEETAKQFETELKNLENKGAKGVVIDLRNNPGGMMDQSIKIADMLLPEAMITYTEDREGKKETYNSDEHCTKLNYVLLVNENSASAAEIIAAAIKDNEGGKLVGQTTFGKGIIQGTIDLHDGSAMSLTIMQYFSPKGSEIHENGVEPDYVVELPEDAKTDKQLEKALKLLK